VKTVAAASPQRRIEPPAARLPAPAGGLSYSCADVAVRLGFGRDRRLVLEHVNLTIPAGEIVTVVGGSGTGKTTLLRALGGLAPVQDGLLTLGEAQVDGPPRDAVTVFQDYANALLPWRTVARNVELGMEAGAARCPRDERRRRVADALRMVGLADHGDDRPWQLSGGMQQRVQLARALAIGPRVLLMDEPFGALDAMTKAGLQDELLDLHAKTRATIVFVTHDIDEAIYLADRVLVLGGRPGRIRAAIDVALPRPRHPLETKEHREFAQLRHRVHLAVRGRDDDR
jgi:NitT/TauT family transport system ATP-binding protein